MNQFITETQSAAGKLLREIAWPVAAVDKLPLPDMPADELANRAERRKYQRINEQYKRWMDCCTLREIDADIYAEHLMSGNLPGISVCIDHRSAHVNLLADTLDSLGNCLGQPVSLSIISELPAPAELADDLSINWIVVNADASSLDKAIHPISADWLLVVKSGTRIAPQGLVEWALATRLWPASQLIYADDDICAADGQRGYPNFKPDANIELLRCTNYLGNAVLLKTKGWEHAGRPLSRGRDLQPCPAIGERSRRVGVRAR